MMLPEISKIKGIHPGAILQRQIAAQGILNKEFASQINEYAQTLSAILNERRGITPGLSIKLGRYFNIEESYFLLLQAYYEISKAQEKEIIAIKPDLSKIRPALFWDTNLKKIDWHIQKKSIIKRVFERGNQEEILLMIDFYGIEVVREVVQSIKSNSMDSFTQNVKKYL